MANQSMFLIILFLVVISRIFSITNKSLTIPTIYYLLVISHFLKPYTYIHAYICILKRYYLIKLLLSFSFPFIYILLLLPPVLFRRENLTSTTRHNVYKSSSTVNI